MRQRNETVKVESIFGAIELEYIPAAKHPFLALYEDETPETVPSHWRATVVDGKYKGRKAEGFVQSKALKNIILEVATLHASDIQDVLDEVDTTFTGGPEDA